MRAILALLLVAGAMGQGALSANPPEVIEGAALPLDGDTLMIAAANRFGVGVERAQASPVNRSISSRVTPTESPESTILPQVVSSIGIPSRRRSTRVSASKSPGS